MTERMVPMTKFPNEFLWGAASAAYQIEGGVQEGGRGKSIWDVFSHTPGKIRNGDTGDIACDSYHRWQEDVDLVKELGLDAYRFSIAWPRIAPNGDTSWNKDGFDYYDRIVDALLESDIQPWVTLYHWDLPQALQNKGGWQNAETIQSYAVYAAQIADHFKGRVTHWFTFNEPQCFIGLGYGTGEHAPGLRLGNQELDACWKNFRLAHTLAADILHQTDSGNLVGLASTGTVYYPVSDRSEDINAARQLTFGLPEGIRSFAHALALDENIGKMDFLGINLYHGIPARMGPDGPEAVSFSVGCPRTAMDWPITPQAMEWGPRFLGERYRLPMYISENGLSCRDQIFLDGSIHDPLRIDFLTQYLHALRRGINAGADVRGYFHWSLTDNFEWAEGFEQRFGLAHVDYATGVRTLKDSAYWYRQTAEANTVW